MNSSRNGGRILVDQLLRHGVRDIFCVPGESYLAVLDALYDAPLRVTTCRHEGGAAIMADAVGKLTGRPGIAIVTRAPGATNASHGVHIAEHDSTPMILLVGQIARSMRGRGFSRGCGSSSGRARAMRVRKLKRLAGCQPRPGRLRRSSTISPLSRSQTRRYRVSPLEAERMRSRPRSRPSTASSRRRPATTG